MPKHSEKLRKIGIALAVSALTGSLTASTWAATNAPGTGNGVAIGEGATAAGNSDQSSIAIGKDADAKFDGSLAIGDGAKISGNGAIAVGQNASSEAGQAISIGVGAKSKGDGSYAIGGNANAEGLGSIVIGKDTKAASGNSIVIGTNSKAESYTTSAVAIGDNIKLDGNYGSLVAIGSEANASGIGAVALGGNAKTSVEGGVAIGRSSLANRAAGGYGYIPQSGNKTGFIGGLGGITPDREAVFNAQRNQDIETSVYKSTGGAVSVGRDAYTATDGTKVLALTRQITNVAAGGQDTDAVNLRQLKDLSQAVGTQLATKLDANAYKYVSINSSETGNKDNKGATGGNSIAIGPNATATAVSNVAIGEDSTAGGKGYATALGSGAKADNTGAVAIGSSANVTGVTGIAMGYEAKATGTNSVALGMRSQATGYGIAIGQAKALSQSAIALGDAANIDNASSYAIGIGDGVAVTNAKQAVVAGVNAKANNSQQVVLLGSQAKATNSGNSVVIGTSAQSSSVETVAIGKGTIITDKAASALAIGNSAYIGEMKDVDPGTKPSDTANPGYRNQGTSEEIMTNPLDKSKYYFSTAVGTDAKAFGYQNTAFGAGAEAHNTNSLALGFIAVAKGDFSAAIGRNTNTDGTYATAVGFSADATGESTLALGSRAEANKASGVALGADSVTNVDKGVFGFDPSGKNPDLTTFLGANKAAYDTLQTDIAAAQTEVDTARKAIIDLQNSKNGKTTEEIAEIDKNLATAETTLAEKKTALAAKVKESNQMISTWQATAAGVSVGDSETGLTRQINNVAAGTLDTDAVNVAQLKNIALNVTGDNLKTDSTAIGNVNLATQQLAINGDSNITTTVAKDGQTVNLALSKAVTDKLGAVQYFSVNSTQTANKDNKGATGTDSIAIGPNASSTEELATALGANTSATGVSATAIGESAKAEDLGATALGALSEATASGSAALGNKAKAKEVGATAVGVEAEASGKGALAAGNTAKATAENATALGVSAKAEGVQSVALGGNANSKGIHALAFGSSSLAKGDQDIAIGTNTKTLGGGNSVAIGTSTTTLDLSSVAIGASAKTNAWYSVALGQSATTNGGYGTSVGAYASAASDSGVALGNRAVSRGYQAVSLGSFSNSYGYRAVSVGSEASSNGTSATALGDRAEAPAREGIALGGFSVASTEAGALGYNPLSGQVLGTANDIATLSAADKAAVSELAPKVAALKAEYVAKEEAYNSRIVSLNKELTAARNSLVNAETDETKAELNEKISILTKERSNLEMAISNARNAYVNSEDYVNYSTLTSAWEANSGAVSVGDTESGITRQITNVAAGTLDTDAVNVAQLKAARVDVVAGNNVSSVDKDTSKGYTEYKVNAVDTKITNVAFDKTNSTLSITTNNDAQPFTVSGLATKDDVTTAVGNSSWTLGVAKVPSILTSGDGEAAANGESTTVKNGDAVTLRAARGIKLNQDGTNIDIGLKYIDVDPAVDAQPLAISDAKATGGGTLAVGQNSIADGHQGTAVGLTSHAGEYSLAVGAHADASAARSLALGYNTSAGVFGVAAGSQAKAVGNQSVAIGTFTVTNGTNSIGIGLSTKKDGATSDAPDQYLPKTNSQAAIAIGAGSYVGEKATNATVIGVGNKIIGVKDSSNNALLLGSSSSITEGQSSLLLGNKASINKSQNAVGVGSQSNVDNSHGGTAVGFQAIVTNAVQGTAVGGASQVSANQATALGGGSKVTAAQGLAVGYSAETSVAHGVALGTFSVANRGNAFMGYNPLTGKLMENDEATIAKALGREADLATYNETMQNADPASKEYLVAKTNKEILLASYKSGMSAVSVGRVNLTRQITNVAAGTADTDAVNVAQLKAAKVEVAGGTNVTVDTDTTAGYTKYTVNSVDTDTKVVDGTAIYKNDGTGSITLNTNQNGTQGTVSVTGLQDKYITDVTLQDGTLSITRNDTDTPFTVTNIATKDDVTSAVGDSAWKLGVGVASTAPNSGDATAIGTATSIKNGNEVILRADRGIKLNQVGSNIDIGLKYIDMDPSTDIAPDQIVDAKASGHASLAVGQNSVVDGHQGTAVGFSSHAGQYALAAGSKADASGSNSVALGYNINVTGQGAIGIGNSKAKGSTTEEYLPKVASNFGIAIGDASYVDENSKYGTVVGPNAVITNSEKGTALGQEATIDKSIEGLALGNAAKIYSSEKGIALGSGVTVNESNNAVIIGNTSQIYKSPDSIAIGTSTAVTNSKYSVGIGNGATVNADSAVALGQNANVGARAGVALGSDSVAKRVAAQGYDPLLNKKGEYYNDKIAAEYGFADRYKELVQILNNSPENTAAYSEAKAEIEKLVTPYVARAGAVSVGKEGYTRQITNVAAGLEDTDAVNVAQLKRLRATGTNYSGDDTTAIHRDLGDELTITGGADVSTAEAKAKLTTGNIGVVANDTTDGLELKLAKDINLTADGSVAFGTAATAPKVDKTGLTVSDAIKFTNAGISAGNQTVDNVKSAISDKAGDTFADKLNAALTNNANSAVNVGDLNSVTDELADKIGDANTAADSKLGKFTVGTDKEAKATGIDVDKDNTRFDILGANENITTAIEDRQVKIGLANTLNLTDAGSISFGNGENAPKLDATGLTISEQLKFTTAGISAGNQTIDNVKSAISDKAGDTFADKLNAALTDNANSAVNVSDLKQTAEALAGQIGDANTVANSKLESFVVGADKDATAAGITVDKGTEGKTNRFDIVGANENITTKVTGNTIEVGLGKDLTLTDGSITTTTKDGITTKVDGTGVTITPIDGDATKSVSLTNEGLNNGGNKITNVADGEVSANSKDAVNGSQLHAVKEELKGDINKLESKLGAAGDLTKVDQNGNPVVTGNDGKNYNPDDVDENGNPKDGAKPVESTLGSGADTSGLGLDNKDNSKPISEKEAKDIIGGTPGADGQPGKDGLLDKTGPSLSNLVTVKDLQAVAQAGLDFGGDTGDTAHRALSQKLTVNGGISDESKLTDNNIGVVSNGTDTLTVKLAKNIDLGKDGSVTTGNTTINNDGLTVKGEDGKPGTTVGSDGMVVNGDDGKPATTVGKDGISTNGKDGISVNGEDGSSTTIKPDGVTSKDPNGNSTVLGPNGVEVKDKDGNTVVTINDKGISNNNGGPTNLNDGLSVPGGLVVLPGEQVNGQYVPGTGTISAEGNRIQNVAPGIAPTDAVNVGQLNGVKHDLNNRMNTIGAHAAAMAALHPMEYLEDEKLSIAAGVGTFQSKQALAVGAFYRPNDDTMFSVGGSFGGSENMFNVGVSLRVGQDSDYAKAAQNYKQAPLSTMTVLDDKVNHLEKENAALKDQLEEQRQQIKMLMERLGV